MSERLEHHHRERSHATQLSLALSLPLWDRIARRRLRLALSRWMRRARIVSAQTGWTRLVVEQRQYLLRKLVLQAHWQRVALAFERWRRAIRSFTRIARRVATWRCTQLTRLAVAKWRRLVLAERLEEEAAACRCVMWTRKADRLVARRAARDGSEGLVVFWLAWKNWYRRERCKAWRHGMSMAARKYFVGWQRYYAAVRAHRALVKITACEIMDALLDDCLAQCLWRQNLRNRQRQDAILHVQRVLQRWSAQIQRQRLAHTFSQWQSLLAPTEEEVRDEVEPSPVRSGKVPTFPERFSAAYRKQRGTESTKPARSHRRSWR